MPDEPLITSDLTRKHIIEGLRELYRLAVKEERRSDSTFRRWPSMEEALDHLEKHGLPPAEPVTPINAPFRNG